MRIYLILSFLLFVTGSFAREWNFSPPCLHVRVEYDYEDDSVESEGTITASCYCRFPGGKAVVVKDLKTGQYKISFKEITDSVPYFENFRDATVTAYLKSKINEKQREMKK